MNTPNNNGATVRARNNAKRRAELIEEAEFLLHCRVGEAAILSALGYTHKPKALQKRLERAGRADLIHRIFEWQAMVDEQQHFKRAA